MFSDPTRQRKMLQRLIPLFFRQSRVVQVGEPLKVSEAQKQRNLWWYQCARRLYWPLDLLLLCACVAGIYYGFLREIVPGCGLIVFYMTLFGFFQWKIFVPFRWIIVRDGIWLRSSKDVSRFLPWRSIVQVDTDPKAKSKMHRIDLVTDAGERETFKSAEDLALLPFVNKLLAVLPHGIDPEPLQVLQRQLRRKILYDALYAVRDMYVAFAMMLYLPVFIMLHCFFPVEQIGFAAWGVMMGIALLLCVGIYIMIRRAVVHRHDQQVEQLMQELDEMDVARFLQAKESPQRDFGKPPRSASPNIRWMIFFSGDLGAAMLMLISFMAFVAFIFGGVLWFDNSIDFREASAALLGFGMVFGLITSLCVGVGYFELKQNVQLLETANVIKYRIRKCAKKGKQVKTILTPLGGGEPLEKQLHGGLVGETVHVFLDEAKPNQSFIAERFRGNLRYNAETGEIDCDPDPCVRYAKWALLALTLGIGVIVLRLIWVW